MTAKHILILGGTADARRLAERLAQHDDLEVVTSLAGRTTTPANLPGTIRVGGFGGAAGLTAYLTDHDIAAVIDATHPFAARISANAKTACEETHTPRLYLGRPRWTLPEDANVIRVADFAAAADHIAATTARVLLTTGTQDIDCFSGCRNARFLVRLIETPTEPLPLEDYELILAHPPFTVDAERTLMAEHAIDTLITKDSGGDQTAAKIAAAAGLHIKIIVIERPSPPVGDQVRDIESAVNWIAEKI